MKRLMTDYDIHQPDYSGTTTEDWSAPRENDFDTDDFSEISDHFVLSSSGFPPEEFTDLKLPVVDPDGSLNLNALEAAHGGAHSVEAIDAIDDDTKQRIKNMLESLSQSEFDHQLGGDGQ